MKSFRASRLALVWGMTAAMPGVAAETDRVVRTLTLHPHQSIVVEGTVGDVAIQGWDRPDISVEVTRTAPTRDLLSRLPIVATDDTGSDLRVSVVQPADGKDPRLRAAIAMSVPRRARFSRVQLFEGALTLKELSGEIQAVVSRGPIQASRLEGSVRLETTIGAIDLDEASLTPGGVLRLRTFNGDVKIALRERPADARILALTLNGRIASAIPLERRDQFGPRFAGAVLGRGEPVLSIDVVTGDITIEVGSRKSVVRSR